ncbi:LigA [Actinotalea ferrariae CF5-4]|uniref:LigA n=1 Tax=Actinotalea ferrariae CF5-4 TaxID=948458 RepID=A0A021VLI6_9CELL|nr:hypothetical protein [Actinotalea ferrariae]EYR62094.1 LigA [Actinotalea ferrariae CF5-4]
MSEPSAPVRALSLSTVRTYRYLRLAVVALALLLATSLALEARRSPGLLESISAYYYSPVRAVLVGSLVAIGLALIAIAGRPGAEDTLLNLAGMLVPVVAFVPTPVEPAVAGGCPPGTVRCVPANLVPAVENNVAALLVVGAVGILAAGWMARAGGPPRAATRWGLTAAAVVWAGFGAWFLLWPRESFLAGAHYAAAVPFFGLVAAVAVLDAVRVRRRTHVRVLSPHQFSGAYAVVAVGMVGTIVVAGLVAGAEALTSFTASAGWVFVVEAVLLVLFTVFWALQTAENWEDGVPDPA